MSHSMMLLLIAVLATAFYPKASSEVSDLNPRDAAFQKYTFVGCDSAQTNMIKRSYSHVHDILNIQRDSLSDVQEYLNGVLNDKSPQLTSEIKNKLNTFMMFFGEFDYSEQCEIADNIDRAEQVVDVVRRIDKIISDFAFSGTYAPTIFCTDDRFKYIRTVEGERYYTNTVDRNQREIIMPYGTESGLCDDAKIGAAMLYPATGEPADWMLFCPSLFEKWLADEPDQDGESNTRSDLRYLSDYRALSLETMRGKRLDHVHWNTPEGIMLHELSHSLLIFNLFDVDNDGNREEEALSLDDIDFSPGEPAYHFDGVAALAKLSRHDPVKMVRNAETITYHAIAVYLGQCNWAPDGICKAPAS